ncbi:DUF5724 domain-containing protein [Rhodopirellula sp. MGV]|uniref:DUF5724 domain-containing protein n=1 Tax=Rhodopirellula sp. MGV TaxID=2023130 RepID=UPI000B965465|nr:DUF5724 domain-containing protein [Rhodopirellula sp. MGV]OYP37490.1 hypothetical protein CGZ80_05005 [Rhodopirellula sp. MGV]PNY37892.1 DUF4132 domain-containing protein [Rhodopirellula baltica]
MVMKYEDAQKHFEQWLIAPSSQHGDDGSSDEEIQSELDRRLKKAPAKLRRLCWALYQRDEAGDRINDWQEARIRQDQAQAELNQLSSKDLNKLIRTATGSVAPLIETAWDALANRCACGEYEQKPVRSKTITPTMQESRATWLRVMFDLCACYKDEVLTLPNLAIWAPYLYVDYGTSEEAIGFLLAANLSAGHPQADETYEILRQIVNQEHEIGTIGDHVLLGLWASDRKDGWELVERLLLAAKRQEGLRQSILRVATDAHPDAFARLLVLLHENDLARYSSVVQALDEWLGWQWSALAKKQVHDSIATLANFTTDPAAAKSFLRPDKLTSKNASDVYLALWTISIRSVEDAIAIADTLINHSATEIRYAVASYLAWLYLPAGMQVLVKAICDEDDRVALKAIEWVEPYFLTEDPDYTKYVELEDAEALFERLPAKPKTLAPIVWPWTERKARQSDATDALFLALGDQPATRLLKYLRDFDVRGREALAGQLAELKPRTADARDALITLVGDVSMDVREIAVNALLKDKLTSEALNQLTGFLKRTSADLRSSVIALLLAQNDATVLDVTRELCDAKNKPQRLAGLELLRCLAEGDRQRETCVAIANDFGGKQKRIGKDEQSQLDAILVSHKPVLSVENGFGLLDASQRTPVVAPRKNKSVAVSAAARAMIKSLDDLVHKHRKESITFKDWRGRDVTAPLGEADDAFSDKCDGKTVEQARKLIPLPEIWEAWFEKRPKSMTDSDGLEVMRAFFLLLNDDDWDRNDIMPLLKKSAARKSLLKCIGQDVPPPKLRFREHVQGILEYFLIPVPESDVLDYLLDVTENLAASFPQEDIADFAKPGDDEEEEFDDPSYILRHNDWLWQGKRFVEANAVDATVHPTKQQWTRMWNLMRWFDEPMPGLLRNRCPLAVLAGAYGAGVANLADVIDHFVGPRNNDDSKYNFSSLESISQRIVEKGVRPFAERDEIRNLVDSIRTRLLEIELARGESATPATGAVQAIGCFYGTETLLSILRELGDTPLKKDRSWRANAHKRNVIFTELVQATYPSADETPAQFGKLIKQKDNRGLLSPERLVELSFLAPQWAEFAAEALGWKGFLEAFYWFMAHMRYVYGMDEVLENENDVDDDDDDVDADNETSEYEKPQKLSAWERLIRQRTPLTESDRNDGAIDVQWFHQVYADITPKQWQMMANAAKLAATPAAAKRAQLISDVLLGKASKQSLVEGIEKKNLKENVRLLGLLPLAKGKAAANDLLDRYSVMQAYHKYAKTLGSMSRPEALRSVEIGMQNLANTAGYPDPMRLQWALEAESTQDLAAGPVIATKDDVELSLEINSDAEPELTIRRGDKTLKSVPTKLRKHNEFVELRERAKSLRTQSSRMNASLEQSMCRCDVIRGSELAELANHALMWPKIQRLVLIGEGIMGYPDKGGKALRDHAGKLEPVKKTESLRIAHPYDLLKSRQWTKWQQDCFTGERIQPFKQVFRELYVITAQEKKDKEHSLRYAAHQVNPRQANRLWASRDWTMDEYDDVFKTFYQEKLRVEVSFNHGITTPLQYEGLTIEAVTFYDLTTGKRVPLTKVPPVIFSEVMRDMDLVVSVAHVGEVDPEATASTVELRQQLVKETCRLLKLKNVKVQDSHAVIEGKLGDYSVHLGSAVVHRIPGSSVCIVPVHSQHRGKLFLPFADNDPRTAEVVSKVLLLAKDDEIQDPIILDQLRDMAK